MIEKEKVMIGGIPAVVWGAKKEKVFIAVHGDQSNKEDEVIRILAEEAIRNGCQVLSFDLPEHGDRKNNEYFCKPQNCVSDLLSIMRYSEKFWKDINVFACSVGAYFALLAYSGKNISKALFLSPIVDMHFLIKNMMIYSNVTEEQLQIEKEIDTSFGKKLYWDYFSYVKNNYIESWDIKTYILYGKNDNLTNIVTLEKFCDKFNCELAIYKDGEHYFYTKEQLKMYRLWLQKDIFEY